MIKSAIILAGGNGERLRPHTSGIPKPMVKVGDYPMVEYQVALLSKFGVKKIIFAAGYCAEVIEKYWLQEKRGQKYGLGVVMSTEEVKLDTGGAIKKALVEKLSDEKGPFLVTNGDTFWPSLDLKEMEKLHQAKGKKATLMYVPLKSPWGVSTLAQDGLVESFGEKIVIEDRWVSGGVYILEKDIVDELPEVGPIEAEPFESLVNQKQLVGFKYLDFWRAIDTAKDQTEVEKFLATPQASGILSFVT